VATVAVIGERALVRGWSLAGAVVTAAEDADEVRTAWCSLGDDVAIVVLTTAAARVLSEEPRHGRRLTVVLPS
jgi:vacuolar-type H+-ATPase subunit F/Vma7